MHVKDQSTFIMIFVNIKKDMKAEVFIIILFDPKILKNKTKIKTIFIKQLKDFKIQVSIKNYHPKCFQSFSWVIQAIWIFIQVFQSSKYYRLKTKATLLRIKEQKF